jgi:predicted AAA+ superfamily ATPase
VWSEVGISSIPGAAHAPCLILVDEWVAYARNLVSNATLPAGTFDSQVSFAQALTEAVKQVPNALLLISVPQSVNEGLLIKVKPLLLQLI